MVGDLYPFIIVFFLVKDSGITANVVCTIAFDRFLESCFYQHFARVSSSEKAALGGVQTFLGDRKNCHR